MSWPATLTEVDSSGARIELRPIRMRDRRAWAEVRTRNEAWLRPWDATVPPVSNGFSEVPPTFATMVRRLSREAREGRMLPWAIEVDGQFAGQLTVGGIAYGSLRGAYIGYWIDQRFAGRGIVPTTVAMALDYCFEVARLHRIEINIRPENAASLRVVEKLGFRPEGLRLRYLHIDGGWRDHLTFALCSDEVPGGLLARLRAGQATPRP